MFELVLVLALLALLGSMAALSLHGLLDSARVRDGATRLAALLRTARAQAGNEGKRFRLHVDADTGQPVVSVEADPLEAPGEFVPYQAWWIDAAQLAEGVTIARCERTGPDAFADLDAALHGEEDEDAPATITFYPDGTSDSARLILARCAAENLQAVEITLNGIDGAIRRRQLDPEENEDDAKLVEEIAGEP